MKKILLYTMLLVFFFSCQEKKKNEIIFHPLKEKKKEKDTSVKHKKGIEHIADYQHEIRKGINEEKSTYKKGNLIIEYKKAKQNQLAKKSASSITPVFKERGPVNVPGRTRGIAIDPTNSSRWYVGTVGGGVWLTEDNGTTWSNITDNKILNLSTSTIVISPQDKNTLYVGTGEPFGNLGAIGGSGVFKTTDGGTTWQHLTSTTSLGDVGRIIINPSDKNNILMGTSSGIYRTTNGGMTWTRTYTSTLPVQDLDADPTNFNIQYGSIRTLGIVKSSDGGITWTTIFNRTNFNINHIRFETSVSPADPNTLFLSVYTGNNGATVGVNTDFYVSRDKGASFTNLKTMGTAASANLLTGQGWYDNVIMAHPYNSNIFYVGGVAVFKVTISGENFTSTSIASGYDSTQINNGVHVDQHGLFTTLGTGSQFRILLANDGGVYSTTMKVDPGATEGDWSSAVSGKNSTQFYGASKQNGQDNYVAGAQDNGSWVSLGNNSDKNKTYTLIRGGDGYKAIWHYDNPGDILVTSQFNGVGRFINFAGVNANAAALGNNAPFYSKLANANNNPDIVFAVTADGVWRSTDFSGSWDLTPITSNFTPSPTSSLNVRVSPADPNIVWAGAAMTESGSFVFHVSQDNGQTFSNVSPFAPAIDDHNFFSSGIATSYIEKNRAYLLFSAQGSAKIIKTEDLGATWTDISGFTTGLTTSFPDVAVHSLLEMPFDKDLLWAGTDIGIFETEDGGATWSLITNFPPVAVYDMQVVNDQVVIASYGRGIWTATISELNSYTLASYLNLPTVSANQKEIESLKTIVDYNVTSDDVNRVKIFIDDVEQTEVTQDFNTGVTYNYETADLAEGTHKIGIQLFDDTNNIQTPINNKEFIVIDFKTPSNTLKITAFESSDVFVFNSSFGIDNLGGEVSSAVLNNQNHPYEDNRTYSVVLKQPLTLSVDNDSFVYEDAAIVEPYTNDLSDLTNFFDYVLIEGSTDLKTWTTIDRYDARRFPEWLTEFNKGTNATINDNLFKKQTISLSSKGFSNGDTIVFRLSLVTDLGTTSYGWAIKSINNNTLSVQEVLFDKKAFTVYPTISDGNFTIFAKNRLGISKMSIFNISGKQVYKKNLDFNTNEKQVVSVNLTAGVYIVSIIDNNNQKSSNKIIIE